MRYQIRHANVSYAANEILKDINFEIHDTEKVAIVGRNGCGKTTLLKLISGELSMDNLDSDEECGITMAGKQQIGYLKQISFEDEEITARQEILKVFSSIFSCEEKLNRLTVQMQEKKEDRILLSEYAKTQTQYETLGGYTYKQEMESMFQSFGFPLSDLDKKIGEFSGGQQTKIAFAKLLLSKPDIMLLDEPTNHLDMPTIEWLEGYLKNYKKAVVLVSHDRMFLDRVTDITYEIEYHRIKRYVGNYSKFMELKQLALEKQEKDYEAQQAEIKRLTDWIEKWKNTPTKVAATRSKRMVIEHMDKIEKPRRFDTKSFHAQFAPKLESQKDVLIVRDLKIGYDKVLSETSFVLKRGQRLAVIGENGKGKSTLLRTIIGEIPSLGGELSFGVDVEWVYFDQQAALQESADPSISILDDFWNEYPNLKEVEVRQALGNFLFSGEDVYKLLGQLSGGEKVRLALCKLLKTRPNFLILDEPTNHMDIIGKQALESMLKNYTGTVLYVSHDRYFIKETATGILDFEADKTVFHPVTYEEYLEEKGLQITDAAVTEKDSKEKTAIEKAATQKGAKPTLEGVFDKKTYYNPGKIEARRKQQIAKYEKQLQESEERLSALRLEQVNPEYATDYEKLTKIEEDIAKEEALQENLLGWLLELEMETDNFMSHTKE